MYKHTCVCAEVLVYIDRFVYVYVWGCINKMCVPPLFAALISTSVVKIPSPPAAYWLPLCAHVPRNVPKFLLVLPPSCPSLWSLITQLWNPSLVRLTYVPSHSAALISARCNAEWPFRVGAGHIQKNVGCWPKATTNSHSPLSAACHNSRRPLPCAAVLEAVVLLESCLGAIGDKRTLFAK
jgi:hypothetical protein